MGIKVASLVTQVSVNMSKQWPPFPGDVEPLPPGTPEPEPVDEPEPEI